MTESVVTETSDEVLIVAASTARALLRLRSDTAGRSLAELLVRRYASFDDDQKTGFFGLLLNDFGAERDDVDAAIRNYQADPSESHTVALSQAADSQRLSLFRALNTARDGIGVLLDMRAQILARSETHPELAPVEKDLQHLLKSWFNRGFLHLEQLCWTTPAHILESLIRYEAVHEIRGWDDLRRRLAPDRRSFGFFHPALPDEPIIFVEVALTKGLATSIQDVIDAPPPETEEHDADTAIFYSITNCQSGLRGVSFGSFLIKQVTEHLMAEDPDLKTFATLSPIPGFASWLSETHPEVDVDDKTTMRQSCAEYLLTARQGNLPLDPVARFHLRNGACVAKINWCGDTSPKGIAESHGMLVNYLYSDQDLLSNNEALTLDSLVTASDDVIALLAKPADDLVRRVEGSL